MNTSEPSIENSERARRSDGSAFLFGALLLGFVGLFILFWASVLAWGLRDGLGPDSGGFLALHKFLLGLRWPLLVFVLPCFGLAGLLYWRDVRRSA